jgi:hypothetical protein
MKTSPIDFILSSLLLSIICGLDLLLVKLLGLFFLQFLGLYRVIVAFFLFLFFFGILTAFVLRTLLYITPLSPGTYTMDDRVFTQWKLCSVLYEFGRGALLPFTTVISKPLVAALFGAKLGKNIAVGGAIGDPWLVELADGAVLGHQSTVVAHAITSGRIVLQSVRIAKGATVGVHVVIMPGVEVGENSVVAAGAVVALGTKIPSGELWGGIPAKKIKYLEEGDIRG